MLNKKVNEKVTLIKSRTGYKRIHGSPADRGSADRYYGRSKDPHKYPNGTNNYPRINAIDLTKKEIAEYNEAYDNETDRKDWGVDPFDC